MLKRFDALLVTLLSFSVIAMGCQRTAKLPVPRLGETPAQAKFRADEERRFPANSADVNSRRGLTSQEKAELKQKIALINSSNLPLQEKAKQKSATFQTYFALASQKK